MDEHQLGKDPLRHLVLNRLYELMEQVGAELNLHVRGDGCFHFLNEDRLRIQSRLWKFHAAVADAQPLPGPMVSNSHTADAGGSTPAVFSDQTTHPRT